MPQELNILLSDISKCLVRIQKDFEDYQKAHFRQKSSQFFCLELNGEAGELANLEKKDWKGDDVDFSDFEDEAADVFIALMNYANEKKINISDSVTKKLNKIEIKRLELEKENKLY
jgi:NTP pyrophosphatase (non-canonical NTP hydrolase)